MKEEFKFIFDMDGTLYQFDGDTNKSFVKSRFSRDLQLRINSFFSERFGLSLEGATSEVKRLNNQYNGEISLGLEAECGIDRSEYFGATWDLDPTDYIERDPNLRGILEELRGRIALLTAAPRIWAQRVLSHLDVDDIFEDKVFTGDPDERKPSIVVFQNIATIFGVSTSSVFSIGDQEQTDIIPAKSIGMKTVRIGSPDTVADYCADDIKLAIELLRKEGVV